MGETVYATGFAITGFLVFIGTWIYCMATYGFLLGFGLGWLPALILAYICGALWPLVALVVAALALMIFK